MRNLVDPVEHPPIRIESYTKPRKPRFRVTCFHVTGSVSIKQGKGSSFPFHFAMAILWTSIRRIIRSAANGELKHIKTTRLRHSAGAEEEARVRLKLKTITRHDHP